MVESLFRYYITDHSLPAINSLIVKIIRYMWLGINEWIDINKQHVKQHKTKIPIIQM